MSDNKVIFQVQLDDHDSFYQIDAKALRGIFDVPTEERFEFLAEHGEPALVSDNYGAIYWDECGGESWDEKSYLVEGIREALE